MIVSMYRVQDYKVPIVNPRWPPKIQDGRYEIHFFTFSPNKFLKIIGLKNKSTSLESPEPVDKNLVNRTIFERFTVLRNKCVNCQISVFLELL